MSVSQEGRETESSFNTHRIVNEHVLHEKPRLVGQMLLLFRIAQMLIVPRVDVI